LGRTYIIKHFLWNSFYCDCVLNEWSVLWITNMFKPIRVNLRGSWVVSEQRCVLRIRQLGNHRSWLLSVTVFILVQVLSLRNIKNLNVYIMFVDTDVNKHLLSSISLIFQFDSSMADQLWELWLLMSRLSIKLKCPFK